MKFSPNNNLTWIPDDGICHSLLKIETDQAEKCYKFGVLYVKEGQSREDDMFSNSMDISIMKNIKTETKNWTNFSSLIKTK